MAGKLKGFTFTVQSPPEGKSGYIQCVTQKVFHLTTRLRVCGNSVCKFFLMDVYARVQVDIH